MDFFIVGTSRSGSTLLRHMLAAYPAVGVLNESHWLPAMWERFGAGAHPIDELISVVDLTRWDTGRRVIDVTLELAGRTWDELLDGLRSRLGTRASIAGFHDALVDEVFGAAPRSIRRGDKTPDYGFYMTTLQRLWPAARFVHIVRNGIDTARSMARHSGCRLMISAGYDNWVPLSYDRRYERYERLDLPFASYVASWCRRMRRIREESAALRQGSYLEVRYETLIADPATTMREVSDHLELAPIDRWLDQCAGLVRPGANRGPVTAGMFQDLTRDDLRGVNDVGGVAFLPFPPLASPHRLEDALNRGEVALEQHGHTDKAIQLALGVLATRTAQSIPALGTRAATLLNEAGASAGPGAVRWESLTRATPRA